MACLQVQALFFSAAATLLLLVPHACTASSTTLLEDECESYAGGDQGSYGYCVWKLRRDKASATADARGLAAIAARMARATAKATAARIAALQAEETVPALRDCLATCAAEYAAAVRRLGRAARDASARRGRGGGGGGRSLQRAETLLAVVAGAPARCDGAFAAAGEHSPLDGADRGLDDEVELAIALLPSPPVAG